MIEAKKKIVDAGLLGKIATLKCVVIFICETMETRPFRKCPLILDYEIWTGPAPLRPYDGLPHVRWWSTFMEYGNGIMGDMCMHMFDTVRWMLRLGWPKRISSTGGIYVDKKASRISLIHSPRYLNMMTSIVCGSIGPGATRPILNIHGHSLSMATRER